MLHIRRSSADSFDMDHPLGGVAEPAAIVHGKVRYHDGPAPARGLPHEQRYAEHGQVLFFATEDRSGEALLSADIRPNGFSSLQVAPGRYYLATTRRYPTAGLLTARPSAP